MGKGLLNSTYYRECPLCKNVTSMDVKDEKINKQIDAWERHDIYLQEIDLPANKREFLKTGYCFECQKLLFGTE